MTTRIISLDSEGRLELPPHSRHQLGIGPGDLLEFMIAEDGLVLRKVPAGCGAAGARPTTRRSTAPLDSTGIDRDDDAGGP